MNAHMILIVKRQIKGWVRRRLENIPFDMGIDCCMFVEDCWSGVKKCIQKIKKLVGFFVPLKIKN